MRARDSKRVESLEKAELREDQEVDVSGGDEANTPPAAPGSR